MNDFVIGAIVGSIFIMIVTLIIMVNRLMLENNAIKASFAQIILLLMKIDRTSQTTLAASEGFMDGLRQSAESMGSVSSEMPPFTRNRQDQFKDLRDKFEGGINRLENDEDDDDEDEEDLRQDWKK